MNPSKLKSWISAMRLRTLPLTLSCIGMGNFLAAIHDSFSWQILLLTIMTAAFLQILSNLSNDYGDSVHGADHSERSGPQREVQSGRISLQEMKWAMWVLALLSLFSGLWLLRQSHLPLQHYLAFLALGLAAILAAILYTNGKLPYGYIGLGDFFVFLFFGLIGVCGSYYLNTKSISAEVLLPAASCGLLSVAVLNINNIRDIESDKVAGKKSIPVRLGRDKAVYYHLSILILSMLTTSIYVFMNFKSFIQLAFLLVVPLLIINFRAVRNNRNANGLDPYLKQMALTTLLFVLLFGFSHLW